VDHGTPDSGFRMITSKGQITIPQIMRKRYNITMQTRLEFVPISKGILLKPVKDEGTFKELAGSASENWTVDEMLKRLDELRKENV
jgi:bifunctional DNA-binding transcriptional regulator/antitoxin component of YhaV-PrlF toxin-antitoxin module